MLQVPKRRLHLPDPDGHRTAASGKPAPAPKKYVSFSTEDSQAIEAAYQKLSGEEDEWNRENLRRKSGQANAGDLNPATRADNQTARNQPEVGRIRVPVNEDYLFDVDIDGRELLPAYWKGNSFDVIRGTWFYVDGRPCDENLANQLEEGYLKIKPWKVATPAPVHQRSASQPRARPKSLDPREWPEISQPGLKMSTLETQNNALEKLQAEEKKTGGEAVETAANLESLQTFRLFGNYMNSVVTYQDAKIARIVDSNTWTQLFGFAGQVVQRGHGKSAETVVPAPQKTPNLAQDKAKTEPAAKAKDSKPKDGGIASKAVETPRMSLERQLSTLIDYAKPKDPTEQEEEARKESEKEIQDDYKGQEGDSQGREIRELLLVTHGIGQRLGLRLESVDFVRDVNSFRTSFKTIYNQSADLQSYNGEVDREIKNSQIQVLPVCWRGSLEFPQQSIRHNRKEYDLSKLSETDS